MLVCAHIHAFKCACVRVHTHVHAYARVHVHEIGTCLNCCSSPKKPLLLMPEVSLGLQMASSLHCCSSPTRLLTVRLLGLKEVHNKLFVSLGDLPGPIPFMLTKAINFAQYRLCKASVL
jgi:hypothetical protein